MSGLQAKLNNLERILTDLGSVLIGYSGGVDSTFLLAAAIRTLGAENVIAATATSPLFFEHELQSAREITAELGARHIVFESDELEAPGVAENPPDRCYHCKRSLFTELREIADREGMAHILHAAQVDDLSDHRPGFRAAEELGVNAPLIEAGLTKDDVRAASREWGLPTWNHPANACLASRLPYGMRISAEKLGQVAVVEAFLRDRGFAWCRVRHHGEVARIEVPPADISTLAEPAMREELVGVCRDAGFTWAALDLEGYRQGSMNEVLDLEE